MHVTLLFSLFSCRGMQMWEYAPQYILGMYAYLLPMATVAKSQFLLRLCSTPCGFKLTLWLLITTITEKWCLLHGTFFSTMLKPGGMSCTVSNLSCITSKTWHGILISRKRWDFSCCQFLFSCCCSENSVTNGTNLPKQMILPKGLPASRSWG